MARVCAMGEHRSPGGRRRLSAPLLRRRRVVCVRVVLLLLVLSLSRVLVPRHVCWGYSGCAQGETKMGRWRYENSHGRVQTGD